MKRFYIILKLVVMTIFVPSAVVAQEFNEALLPSMKLGPFETIRIDGGVDVELYPIAGDEQPRIVYDLDDNDPKKFSFEVSDKGVLEVKHSLASRTIGIVKVRIYYRELSRLELRRAQVRFAEPLVRVAEPFDIAVDAGASLSGDVEAIDIEARVAGSSRLDLRGKCKFLTLEATSLSKVELRSLDLFATRISASLNAVVAVAPSTRLEATASTNAIVKYWGYPTIVRSRNSTHGVVMYQE